MHCDELILWLMCFSPDIAGEIDRAKTGLQFKISSYNSLEVQLSSPESRLIKVGTETQNREGLLWKDTQKKKIIKVSKTFVVSLCYEVKLRRICKIFVY